MQITVVTGQGEIFRNIFSIVFARNNMFDVEGQWFL